MTTKAKERERVVIDCDAEILRKLKGKLAVEGLTLKAWFDEQARAKVGKR